MCKEYADMQWGEAKGMELCKLQKEYEKREEIVANKMQKPNKLMILQQH